jgi:hypothetical protein
LPHFRTRHHGSPFKTVIQTLKFGSQSHPLPIKVSWRYVLPVEKTIDQSLVGMRSSICAW